MVKSQTTRIFPEPESDLLKLNTELSIDVDGVLVGVRVGVGVTDGPPQATQFV